MRLMLTPTNLQKINQIPNLTNEYHVYMQDELVAIIYSEEDNPTSFIIYDSSFLHGDSRELNPILGGFISDVLKSLNNGEIKITIR